jgi:hypothetical protein
VAGEEDGASEVVVAVLGDGGDVGAGAAEAAGAERDDGGAALAQRPQAAAPLGGGVS